MDDETKELLAIGAICGKPVYTLVECITAASHDDVSSDGDSTETETEIMERFRKAVYMCDEPKLNFLRLAADLSEKKIAWVNDVALYPLRVFANNNFVYLFVDNGEYHLVLPVELAEILREVTAEKDFMVANARYLELTSYATALVELYGAYEIQHFATVWNQHHKDKISSKEAEGFLSDLAYFDSDYYFEDNYVVHDCLDADEFDELWENTHKLAYYIPTKTVIRECVAKRHDLNYSFPPKKEMDAFLAKYIKDERNLDEAQFWISSSCTRLSTLATVRAILEEAGAPLKDSRFSGEFEQHYNTLRENSRIWDLRGCTIHQFYTVTGKSIARFRLS